MRQACITEYSGEVPRPRIYKVVKRGSCEYCDYYEGDDYNGFCHRYPPQAIRQRKYDDYRDVGEETGWSFPSVSANSYCGEWKEVTNG